MPHRPLDRWIHPLSLALLIPAVPALAQTAPPDAGSVLQRTERERMVPLPAATPAPLPAAASTPSPPKAASGTTVVVQSFRFEGAQRFSPEQLAEVLASYRGRPVTLDELQAAAAAVATFYREHGWLARVVLPRQDVSSGSVTLRVVEAVFGAVRIDAQASPEEPLRVPTALVQRFIEGQQARAQALRLPDLERGLLLADDLAGVHVSGRLSAGAGEAETDLQVQLRHEPAMKLVVQADNHGASSTGTDRLEGDLQLNSPFGLGEQFTLQAQLASGSEYARTAALLPLGVDGWRVGVNASALRYRVISPEFEALQPQGRSVVTGIDLSHALVRSHDRNLYVSLGADRKQLYNATAAAVTSDYEVHNLQLGLSGNVFDAADSGRGGYSTASVTAGVGRVQLDGSPNQDADRQTTRTGGRFTKWRYSLSRLQPLVGPLSAQLALSGQRASKNLDSAEKFTLGGPDGVRAYTSSEASGSMGDLVSAEVRWQFPGAGECACALGVFYDWGRITVNRDNNFTGAPTANQVSLRGFGVSAIAQMANGMRVSASWARHDGGPRSERLWLNASLAF